MGCVFRHFPAFLLGVVASGSLAIAADVLPVAAQNELEAGQQASRQGNWDVAAEHFELARRAAPYAPVTLYDLAIAESMLPGRELRAAARFEAYLASAPAVPNTAAVRQQIASLMARADRQGAQLLGILTDIGIHQPLSPQSGPADLDLFASLSTLARLQADHGNLAGILAAGDTLVALQDPKETYLAAANETARVAWILAQHGYIKEALGLVGRVAGGKSGLRSMSYEIILEEQAKRGLTTDAQATFSFVDPKDLGEVGEALIALASAYGRAAQTAQTQAMLARATQVVTEMPADDAIRSSEAQAISRRYLESGDWRRAKEMLPLVRNFTGEPMHDQLVREVSSKIQTLFEASLVEDNVPSAGELAEGQPARKLRADDYARLAEQFPALRETGPLTKHQRDLETDLSGAVRANEKFFLHAALERMHAAANQWPEASAERLQALNVLPDALVEPEEPALDFSRAPDLAAEFRNLCHRALLARDEPSLRLALGAVKVLSAKEAEDVRATISNAGMEAALGLAQLTLKADDARGLIEYTRVHPGLPPLRQSKVKDLVLSFYAQPDQATSDELLALLSKEEDRKALATERGYLSLRRRIAEEEPAATAPLAETAGLTEQQSDNLRSELAEAQAREGDFDGAEQTIAAIMDDDIKSEAKLAAAKQQAEGGYLQPALDIWEERLADDGLKWITSSEDEAEHKARLDDLFHRATNPGQYRAVVPKLAPLQLKGADSAARISNLGDAIEGADTAGLYLLERQLRMEAADVLRNEDDFSQYYGMEGAQTLLGSAAEALDLRDGVLGDVFSAKAAEKLAQAGDMVRATRLLATGKDLYQRVNGPNVDDLTYRDAAINQKFDQAWLAFAKAAPAEQDFLALRTVIQKHFFFDREDRGKLGLTAVQGLLAAKRLDEAKAMAGKFQYSSDSRLQDMLLALASAGAIDWAESHLGWMQSDYEIQKTRRSLVILRLQRGDLSQAAETFWYKLSDSIPGIECEEMINAAAKGDAVAWAHQWLEALDNSDRTGAEVVAVAQDPSQARTAIEKIERNDIRTEARRALGAAQLQAGDQAAAQATFLESVRLDRRSPKRSAPESYADYLVVSALIAQGKPSQAASKANSISDAGWRDQALIKLSAAMAGQDRETTLAELAGISDELARSAAGRRAVSQALLAKQPDWALDYAGKIEDEGYQAEALGDVLNFGLDHHEIAPVLPAILALPEGQAKAWLLADVLRGYRQLGIDCNPAEILAAARAAMAATPVDYWHVRLLSELGRLVGPRQPAVAQELLADVRGKVSSLEEEDAARWKQYLHSVQQLATSRSAPTPASGQSKTPAGSNYVRQKAVDQWAGLLGDQNGLGAPLFLDFPAEIKKAASAVPASFPHQAQELFANLRWRLELFYKVRSQLTDLQPKSGTTAGSVSGPTAPDGTNH